MEPVNRRSYTSTVRREQAAHTRARILDAAGELFAERGYARTTVREIADAAKVAPDTVYAVFGNKARVLTALIDRSLAPATGAGSVTDRPEALAVRDEPDQRRQLQLFARDIAALSERVRPVYEIMRTASAVEPEMAAVFAEMDGYRFRNMERVAGWIADRGPLRAGVDVERAAELIWTLASPDVARLLCDVRRWTTEQYAAWLADTLIHAVLPDLPPRRRRP